MKIIKIILLYLQFLYIKKYLKKIEKIFQSRDKGFYFYYSICLEEEFYIEACLYKDGEPLITYQGDTFYSLNIPLFKSLKKQFEGNTLEHIRNTCERME